MWAHYEDVPIDDEAGEEEKPREEKTEE